MSVFQAMLLGVLYYLGNSSIVAGPVGYYTIYRPLIGGFLTGLVLGDPVTGVIVGATINLMYIGFISAGGALPEICVLQVFWVRRSLLREDLIQRRLWQLQFR